MRAKKAIAWAAMSLAAAGGLVATTAGSATADPGTCGVRNYDGPTDHPHTMTYIVRNKCSRAVKMKIKVGGQWLHCKTVPANGYAGWTTVRIDQHWSIGYC